MFALLRCCLKLMHKQNLPEVTRVMCPANTCVTMADHYKHYSFCTSLVLIYPEAHPPHLWFRSHKVQQSVPSRHAHDPDPDSSCKRTLFHFPLYTLTTGLALWHTTPNLVQGNFVLCGLFLNFLVVHAPARVEFWCIWYTQNYEHLREPTFSVQKWSQSISNWHTTHKHGNCDLCAEDLWRSGPIEQVL